MRRRGRPRGQSCRLPTGYRPLSSDFLDYRGFRGHEYRQSQSLVILPETRSEEHTSELQSLMRISYAVFCLKKQNKKHQQKKMNDNEQILVKTSSDRKL